MSEWMEVLRAPVDFDLGPFRRYLQASHVESYVFERDGFQCLCVPADTDAALLQQLIADWNNRDATLKEEQAATPENDYAWRGQTVFSQWRSFPLTIFLLVFSALNFILVVTPLGDMLGGMQWLALMTLQPLKIDGDDLQLLPHLPGLDEVWRYWTPIFLHFSFFHILFNGVLLLELGRRVEMAQGSQRLLFLVMAIGLASNLAQFHAVPEGLFGGMSGVIYGLVGYSWLYQRLQPMAGINAPPGLMTISLVWLVLCFSGLVTMAGMGKIANAAHVGGLLAGLVLAGLLVVLDRRLP